MTTLTRTEVVCDRCHPSKEVEASKVVLEIDGKKYQIDLCEKHAAPLRAADGQSTPSEASVHPQGTGKGVSKVVPR